MPNKLTAYLDFGEYPLTKLLKKMLEVAEVPEAEHQQYIDVVLKKVMGTTFSEVLIGVTDDKRATLLDKLNQAPGPDVLFATLYESVEPLAVGQAFTKATQTVLSEFTETVKSSFTKPEQIQQLEQVIKDYVQQSLSALPSLK